MTSMRPPARFPRAPGGGIRGPVQRLASLRNPNPIPSPRPRLQQKPTTHPKTSTCPNPGCPAPNIVEDDGMKVCSGCGTVVSEANIVSEITFGESASGAAVVQGTFVGAGQSYGRSFGPGFQRGGGMESREITEQNGNRYIAQLSRALNVPESATKAAGQVFKLAVGLNFIQGRRTKTVAAVCLYIACRRQDGNTVMLIDFADVLMINVFKLGRAYKALLDELRLGGNVFIMNPIDPESLIYRFAKQLEFGSSMMQVASEAVRIVQRMNRDWMITGRRPAGICGAALILAARMNNFRRTIREVVYVVKVTELTIHQRLNEFKATESGDLTVDQFRSVQLENAHDPPAFTQGKRLKQAMKQKNATTEIANGDEDENTRQLTTTSSTPRTMRVDADGFAIPDVPIDPALLADKDGVPPSPSTTKAKRGRPKGAKNFRPPPPTASELASESALESEMQELLTTGSNLLASTNSTTSHTAPTAQRPATPQPPKPIPSTPDIDASEFDSDPEVKYCLLSPAEVEIKERIWVHENKDYLRTQQAKALKRALAAEEDLMNGRVPGSGMGRRPRKRRKGRMGDVGYLDGKEGEGEESMDGGVGGGGPRGTRASTPAEATRRMLEQRGFSKKINYRLLEEMYEDGDERKEDKRRVDSESREGEGGGNGGWRRKRRRSASVSSVRSSSVVSDRTAVAAAAAAGGLGIRGPVRERVVRGSRSGSSVPAFVSAVPTIPTQAPAPAPAPAPTSSSTQPQPTATTLGEEAEAATPTPPSTNPHEEILGYIPGPERGEEDADADADADVDGEDTDDEEEDVVEDDHVDEAFAGNYYGGASDDDDDYYF
ncbi:transcription factor tfiiib complex subunit brf1 [Histoplasma capsulatum G186AR]|uniref:B-related factor 1 n=1 Tax=Ajellomyces capsulatus (strain G186AR / H82 / ATCC MYA-2454 / RMSCC 2432) TaxID=447093 RepID=C0NLB0_AJECG|nr:transcription factor tfiiib complex subunit brf1 [Histoplasma capsulatum G186AR]EEH08651.1 transcription factor tfiiib complex subunit brf1 [Histoplasma capsulatum G186AR]